MAWIGLVSGTLAVLSPLPRAGRVAGFAIVVTACLWRPLPVPDGAARVTILDVGQGLSVVVETHRHALVYDAGPSFRTGSDTGQLVVVPYLRARGIRRLDQLVVSHDDDDHKGGARSVLALLPTRSLSVGPSLAADRFGDAGATLDPQTCRRGAAWIRDGVRFAWLHPGVDHYRRDNDSSCVLLVRAGEHTVLITGDIEAAAEQDLLAAGVIGPVDVVVAPHHGSRSSSTAAFVGATRPQWVVYAVGYRNRWKFPVPHIFERWQQSGAKGLLTSRSGAISFDLRPGEPLQSPVEWRLARPRPWRDP